MRRVARALALAAAVAGVARALRGWFPVRVAGASMAPTLEADELLACRPLRRGEPHPGQIVVARAAGRHVVKRAAAPPRVLGPERVWVRGDNENGSTDSRTTGPIDRSDVTGVVVARYWPPGRLRLFRAETGGRLEAESRPEA